MVTTPAVLKGSGSTGRVACHPPVQDSDDTSTAAWSATVGLLEGGLAVPRVNAAGEALADEVNVFFASHGPVVVGIEKLIRVAPFQLNNDDVATIDFTVEDRDSVGKNIALSVKAENEKFATKLEISKPDQGVYTLSVTLDPAYAGLLREPSSEITVTAKDELDQQTDFTFTLVLRETTTGTTTTMTTTTVTTTTPDPLPSIGKGEKRIVIPDGSGKTVVIAIAGSSSEPCTTTCSRYGKRCDQVLLNRLQTKVTASPSAMKSFAKDQLKLSFSPSTSNFANVNHPAFFGFGCGSGTWKWHGDFSKELTGCGQRTANFRVNSKMLCTDSGYRNGEFSGPRVCACGK